MWQGPESLLNLYLNENSTTTRQPNQEMEFSRLVTPPGTIQTITAEGLALASRILNPYISVSGASRILNPYTSVSGTDTLMQLKSGFQTENVGRKVSGTTLKTNMDRKMGKMLRTWNVEQIEPQLRFCKRLTTMTSQEFKPVDANGSDALLEQLQSDIQALKLGRKGISQRTNVVRRMVTTRKTKVLFRGLTPPKFHPISGTASSMQSQSKIKSSKHQQVSI